MLAPRIRENEAGDQDRDGGEVGKWGGEKILAKMFWVSLQMNNKYEFHYINALVKHYFWSIWAHKLVIVGDQ